MRSRFTAGIVGALLATGAGWTPAVAQDSYRLVSVAGKTLPATVEDGLVCREEVTAGTLTLRPDSTWLLETTKREVCAGRTETESDTEDGRYTMQGQTIRFLDDDGKPDTDDDDDDDLDDLTTGTIGTNETLTAKLEDNRTTVVFRR